MGLNWPGISSTGGDIPDSERPTLQTVLDSFGNHLQSTLESSGFPLHLSPFFRPWSVVVLRDPVSLTAVLSPLTGGIAQVIWSEVTVGYVSNAAARILVEDQTGREVNAVVRLPLPNAPDREQLILQAVIAHVNEVAQAQTFKRLENFDGVRHLEKQLREFLEEHPNPDKNVFVMMRFLKSDQLDEAYATIKSTLSERGFHAVRADDRDYTGELWSNIEVYLSCCNLGIAIFEDMQVRDFNPNVSLELGYMLGRGKRCLLLKEQTLPQLPADIVHRLYKPFDQFKVAETVLREVAKWVDVDLGHGAK